MAVPPGISERDFSTALQEFANAIGADWVFKSDEDLKLYRDAYSPFWGEPEERLASAAVAPASVEQVQAIVRIANKHKIPLWTISTGRNLGYGASSPAYSGSVIVDLKRMNRVLEVNDKIHYAVVEPGVSYFDLYRYIQEHKLRVWIDPADPGWGSPTRQRARARRRPHADEGPLERGLRPRGRAAERRAAAHRHGRDDGQRPLAPIQVRLRANRRWTLLAIELRHRDANRSLAHAVARGLSRRARERAAPRRPRAVHGDVLVPHELRHHPRHDAARQPAAHVSRVAGRLVLRDAGRPVDRRSRQARARPKPAVLGRGVPLLGAAESDRRTVGIRQGEIRARFRALRSPTGAAIASRPRSIRTTQRSPSRSASRHSACSACCKAAAISASRRSSR